jgi:type IV pilus assembly protein PilA
VTSLKSLAARRGDDEQGFTLIELMVVVLIIAILIAIAIPTFLGARQRAQDRAAQSDLRNGLTAEKTEYTDTQVYDATTANMVAIESSLNWNDTRGTGKNVLNVAVGDVTTGVTTTITGGVVCLSEASKSGTTFDIVDVAAGSNAGTYYGKGDDFSSVACNDASGTGGTYSTAW